MLLMQIMHTQKEFFYEISSYFEIRNLGEYHDLYVQSKTLLLADVFENFQNICLVIYELDPTRFLTVPGLALQAALKKMKVKLDRLTDISVINGRKKQGICHLIYQYAKANNRYRENSDENKELSYLQYWDVNNLYGWVMSQKLPVSNVEWIKNICPFNKDFMKNCNEESDEGHFL